VTGQRGITARLLLMPARHGCAVYHRTTRWARSDGTRRVVARWLRLRLWIDSRVMGRVCGCARTSPGRNGLILRRRSSMARLRDVEVVWEDGDADVDVWRKKKEGGSLNSNPNPNRCRWCWCFGDTRSSFVHFDFSGSAPAETTRDHLPQRVKPQSVT
jgi:hypothetical protein